MDALARMHLLVTARQNEDQLITLIAEADIGSQKPNWERSRLLYINPSKWRRYVRNCTRSGDIWELTRYLPTFSFHLCFIRECSERLLRVLGTIAWPLWREHLHSCCRSIHHPRYASFSISLFFSSNIKYFLLIILSCIFLSYILAVTFIYELHSYYCTYTNNKKFTSRRGTAY